jgi:hypothetical protein
MTTLSNSMLDHSKLLLILEALGAKSFCANELKHRIV